MNGTFVLNGWNFIILLVAILCLDFLVIILHHLIANINRDNKKFVEANKRQAEERFIAITDQITGLAIVINRHADNMRKRDANLLKNLHVGLHDAQQIKTRLAWSKKREKTDLKNERRGLH